jgi:hypothetical protein
LCARRDELVREQRRLRVEELAVTRVLDERHVERVPEAGLTHRAVREELEVARALESMPAIAEAAAKGSLSWEQLEGVVEVATPATDSEWAERAPNTLPADLQRQARGARVVTPEDAAARREARELRCWTDPEAGMVNGRFRLPDVDGVLVKSVLETVEQLRAEARVVEQRDDAPVVDHGPGRIPIPAALTRTLEHHKKMEPHGTERLLGDPDRPDGLRLVQVHERVDAATRESARAGPAP